MCIINLMEVVAEEIHISFITNIKGEIRGITYDIE
jgi:hypothetical protein